MGGRGSTWGCRDALAAVAGVTSWVQFKISVNLQDTIFYVDLLDSQYCI